MQLLILNSLGLLISFFLVLQHFGLAGSSPLCELGFSFSCSRVLASEYAVLFGAPVAVHGVSYFVLALVTSVLFHLFGGTAQAEFRVRRDVHLAALVVSTVGVLSVVYFIGAEYMIGSVCPLCTVIHVLVVASFLVSLRQFREGSFGIWSLGTLADIAGNRILFLSAAAVVVLLPIVIFNLPARHPSYLKADLDALASCMSKRNVKMYGSNSCGHCIAQKGLFGESFSKIAFINCEVVIPPPQKKEETREFVFGSLVSKTLPKEDKVCDAAKIPGYPTWVKADDFASSLKGMRSLKELAAWADCTLN